MKQLILLASPRRLFTILSSAGLLFAVLLFGVFSVRAQAPTLPGGFAQTVVAEGLNPTAMAFDHHGNLFLAQKDGRVLLLTDDGQLQADPVVTLPVDDFNERGLSGIALHPDLDQEPWIYLYYTVRDSGFNRVSRFLLNGNLVVPGSEQILFDCDLLTASIHNGGAMAFGPDGRLYIGTGDAGKNSNSQDLSVTLGKILRLNADGSIPLENPFFNTLSGNARAIYALGLRNPFGMSIQPGTGRIFVSEVGQGAFEEVNEILPGRNYGWSAIEGPIAGQIPPSNYQDPFFAYPHTDGCAIVGAAFYNPENASFPASYLEKFFFADYCSGVVRTLDPNTLSAPDTFATGLKQPVAFAVDPHSGALFYLMRSGLGNGSTQDNTSTNNGTLWQVFYTGSGAPFVSVPPQDVFLPVGETAGFELQVLGTPPFQFQWQRDGLDLPGANAATLELPNVQLADDGATFRCIVSNAEGSDTSVSAMLRVTANQRPQPQIMLPLANAGFKAGDNLGFQGFATDPEEGILPETKLRWKIELHHDTHTHPALGPIEGIAGGAFQVPLAGETSINTWYRIQLTATDSDGLSQTAFTEIFPEKTTIRIDGPVGLPANVDGVLRPMPYTFESLKRQQRLVDVPGKIVQHDTLFIFEKWTERPDSIRLFAFAAPDTPGLVLHAQYAAYPLGKGTGLHGEYFIDPEFDLDEEPAVLRLDTTINFNWGNASPFPNQIPANGFTARWSGYVQPFFSEDYTFSVRSDDGARLWIGDSLLIDKWVAQGPTEHYAKIRVQGGQKIPIKLEYLEIGGGAEVALRWYSLNTPRSIVPKSQLYPVDPYEPATLKGTVWHDVDYDELIDPGEPLLQETIVLLFNGKDSSLLDTQLTNAEGEFKFSPLLAGPYFLRFLPAPEHAQLLPRTNLDAQAQTALLTLGTLQSLTWNAAFVTQPASIGGQAWRDDNTDGQKQSAEPPLPDITVLLLRLADSSLHDLQFTDESGRFLFNYLPVGGYFLQFDNALNGQGLVPGAGLSAAGFSSGIDLASSQAFSLAAPFVSPPAMLEGRVWFDENGNHFPDLDEGGLAEVTVLLHRADSSFVTARSTDAAGNFSWGNLPPDAYFLLFVPTLTGMPVTPSFGLNSFGQTPSFDLVGGQTRSFELGFRPSTLGGGLLYQADGCLKIFPNPVREMLWLEAGENLGEAPRFSLSDLAGRRWDVPSNPEQAGNRWFFDTSKLPAGVYFLLVETNRGQFRAKFVRG